MIDLFFEIIPNFKSLLFKGGSIKTELLPGLFGDYYLLWLLQSIELVFYCDLFVALDQGLLEIFF